MNNKPYSFLLLLILTCSNLFAQNNLQGGFGKRSSLSSSNQEYTIAAIACEGLKYLDEDLLLSISGLKAGDKIKLENDEKISKAIQNLWKQNLFSDVSVDLIKKTDDKVWLALKLIERPRLSKFNFRGIKRTEAEELRDKVGLVKNRVITEASKKSAIEHIKKFYIDKGYLDISAKVVERPDSSITNTVVLTFDINKGQKVKINQINIFGNETTNMLKIKSQMKNVKEVARLSLHPSNTESLFGTNKNDFNNYIKDQGFLSVSKTLTYLDPYFRYKFFTASKYNDKKFEEDKENIVNYYNSLGNRDAFIEKDTVYASANGNYNIDLKINEGRKYYFGNITWRGNTKYNDSTLNLLLGIKKGEIYNQELFNKRLGKTPSGEGSEDITSIYMDDGYLYFNIDPQETSIINDTINFEIRVTEGQQATIKNIIIVGNDKTHDEVIRRQIYTLPGNKFSRADLIRTQRELANLGVFDAEKIGIKPIPREDGTVDIEYSLVEKSNDQLELQAGLGGGLGITGTLGLSFNNFSLKNIRKFETYDPIPTGDLQKLSIRGQANGKWYNGINFGFTEPWLGGKKPTAFQLTAGRTFFAGSYGSQIDVDTTHMVTWNFGANIIKRLKWPDDNFVLTYGLNYQLFNLVNYRNFGSALFTDGSANNLFFKLALSRYSIDQPLYPRSGSNISLTSTFTLPYSKFNGWSDRDIEKMTDAQKYKWVEYYKFRFTADWYQRVKGNLVLRLAAKHGYLAAYNPSLVSPFERFQLGGNGMQGFQMFGKDIIAQRGYDAYEQNAIMFNKYTLELRYPFSLNPQSTIYGIAFADAANAWNDYKSFNPLKLNRDAGIGVRIFLPMFGMLGLDYGMRFDSIPSVGNYSTGKFGQRTNFTFTLGVEPD